MLPKFCTLAISSSVFLFTWTLNTAAQTPAPTPKVGYVRFWDMLPPANGLFDVRKSGAPATEGALFTARPYQYTSYTELPVGRYPLAVTKKGDTAPLKVLDMDLKPDSFFTILLSPESGVVSVQLLDDTPNPKANSGTLVVRNYFNGLTTSVSANGRKIVDGLQYGQSRTATGFPLTRQQVSLTFQLGKNPAESTAEVDFHASDHATLLIIPDSYGRFCTRVALDGKNL